MADGAPDASLGKRADYFLVEDVDTIGGQILEKRNLIGKAPRFTCLQPRQKGGVSRWRSSCCRERRGDRWR